MVESTEIAAETQIEQNDELKCEEKIKLADKQVVILAIDPGFIKCGFAILDAKTGAYIDSYQVQLRPKGVKLSQSEVDGLISVNIKNLMKNQFETYFITHVVIELQLGNFSCDRVQLALVSALPDHVNYTIQHSKLKLSLKEASEVKADNPTSNKYNQNKHTGRSLFQLIYPDQDINTFDECDAVLHSLYAFRNMSKIKWFKKSELNTNQ